MRSNASNVTGRVGSLSSRSISRCGRWTMRAPAFSQSPWCSVATRLLTDPSGDAASAWRSATNRSSRSTASPVSPPTQRSPARPPIVRSAPTPISLAGKTRVLPPSTTARLSGYASQTRPSAPVCADEGGQVGTAGQHRHESPGLAIESELTDAADRCPSRPVLSTVAASTAKRCRFADMSAGGRSARTIRLAIARDRRSRRPRSIRRVRDSPTTTGPRGAGDRTAVLEARMRYSTRAPTRRSPGRRRGSRSSSRPDAGPRSGFGVSNGRCPRRWPPRRCLRDRRGRLSRHSPTSPRLARSGRRSPRPDSSHPPIARRGASVARGRIPTPTRYRRGRRPAPTLQNRPRHPRRTRRSLVAGGGG